MRIEEMFEQRLLRKIPKDRDKSSKSIEAGQGFLDEAILLMRGKHFKMVIFSSYTSMFHAAKAILYADGVQEKSHYATYLYIKEIYGKFFKNLIFEFNSAREQRHEGIYGLEYTLDENDCLHIIRVAEDFLKQSRDILRQKN